MNRTTRSVEERDTEYWEWISVALFLLVSVDLLTTMGATVETGLAAEANPVMRWLIPQGPVVLAVAHLAVVVVAVLSFSGVIATVRRTPEPYERYFEVVVEVWLGLLVAVGIALFANNLAVIVLGESLL